MVFKRKSFAKLQCGDCSQAISLHRHKWILHNGKFFHEGCNSNVMTKNI